MFNKDMLISSSSNGVESEEESPQSIYYRSGDEPIGVGSRGRKGWEKIYRQPASFLGRSGLWVSRECLLNLLAGIKQQVG